MRKIFAILSMGCLLFIAGGYHLLFQLRIIEAKETMKQELLTSRKKEATQLVFSVDEVKVLEWENSNEFRYKDQMYDVLMMKIKEGQTIIWCIPDVKETALTDEYFKAQKQSSEKNSSDGLLKLLAVQFIPVAADFLVLPFTSQPRHFDHYLLSIPFLHLPLFTPPPKVC